MAKRPEPVTTDTKVEVFAEDLGRLLGSARVKANSWLMQRREIAKHLTDIRDTASNLLTQLGQKSQRAIKRGRAAYRAAADGSNSGIVVGGKK
jgi:hypothetical protein